MKIISFKCLLLASILIISYPLIFDAYAFEASQFGKIPKVTNEAIASTIYNDLNDRTYAKTRTMFFPDALSELGKYSNITSCVGYLDILMLNRETNIKHNATCTASLINSDTIITAKHCVDDGVNIMKEAFFIMGYDHVDDANYISYNVIPTNLCTSGSLDVAILELQNPVNGYEYCKNAFSHFREPINNETLFLISHPLGAAKRITAIGCRSTSNVSSSLFNHSCDAFKGSSGAPIFSKSDMTFIGLHTGSFSLSVNNEATKASALAELSPLYGWKKVEAPPQDKVDNSGALLNNKNMEKIIYSSIDRDDEVLFNKLVSVSYTDKDTLRYYILQSIYGQKIKIFERLSRDKEVKTKLGNCFVNHIIWAALYCLQQDDYEDLFDLPPSEVYNYVHHYFPNDFNIAASMLETAIDVGYKPTPMPNGVLPQCIGQIPIRVRNILLQGGVECEF